MCCCNSGETMNTHNHWVPGRKYQKPLLRGSKGGSLVSNKSCVIPRFLQAPHFSLSRNCLAHDGNRGSKPKFGVKVGVMCSVEEEDELSMNLNNNIMLDDSESLSVGRASEIL
jgi:hypothetical protein